MKRILMYGFLILLAAVLIQSWRLSRTQDSEATWRNVAAQRDELVEVGVGHWRRAAVETDRQRDLLRIIRADNNDLYQTLRQSRAEVSSLTDIIAVAKPETLVVGYTDTVWSEQGVRFFALDFDGALVKGTINPDSVLVTGTITYTPIDLRIIVSRLPDRSWRTDVTAPPWLYVRDIRTTVYDRQPSWWQKARLYIVALAGVYLGIQIAK